MLFALLVVTSPARAWTETAVQSDVATIDIERDGTATVAHEILLRVRGGPLVAFELDGVASDAEPLPEATATPATSGNAAGEPIPLLLNKGEDGVLHMEVDRKKGLGGGTYLFKAKYRTHLLEQNKLELRGAWAEMRYVGPRFNDGIDGMRVVFRVPQTGTPPRLGDAFGRQGASDELDDTFLANLRHASDKDELEVIRPHVAKGEPVLWRIWASPKAFDVYAARAGEEPLIAAPAPSQPSAPRPIAALLALFALAAGYGALVFAKWRMLVRACEASGAAPRALVPAPAGVRAALCGALLAGAAALALLADMPTQAALVFMLTMACAAHVSPFAPPPLRGPGRWLALSAEEAFAKAVRARPGQWLDAGTGKGFSCFVVALAAIVGAAVKLFAKSPYHGALVALGSACLLPIFCTGRASELPQRGAEFPRKFLKWLAERLASNDKLRAVPWARIPDGQTEPDELRLLVVLRGAKAGLLGIEVGLESHQGGGAPIALPYIIVRARDASPSYESLPKDIVWMRGRKPEERVAIIRPKLPTRSMCLALLERLVERLSAPADAKPVKRTQRPFISSRISLGSGSSMANPASSASPSQPR